jgi:hypothetical protein
MDLSGAARRSRICSSGSVSDFFIYENQEGETAECKDRGRLVTNQRTAQTVWADAEATSRLITWRATKDAGRAQRSSPTPAWQRHGTRHQAGR